MLGRHCQSKRKSLSPGTLNPEERTEGERLHHKPSSTGLESHITWEAINATQCCFGWQLCSPGTRIMLGKCFSLILNLPVENSEA